MLLSIWLLVGLAVLTVVVAALLGWVEVRRHRRRRVGTLGPVRAWTARALSLVVVLALVVVTVADRENRQFQYIPSFAALFGNPSPDLQGGGLARIRSLAAHPGRAPRGHGVDVEVTIGGGRSRIRRVAYVYLPPQYFQRAYRSTRFPVLYLLHGSPGVAVDWIRGAQVDRTMDHLLTRHAVQPFIIVMPDTNGGFRRDLECQNVVRGPADETYLAQDVPAWVDAHLRTIPNRLDRAVGGLSTGGYCGLNFTFRHPGTFSAAVSHSGTGQPDRGPYTGDLFAGDRALKLANTPDRYLPSIAIHPETAVYLDAGAGDGWSRHQYQALLPELLRRRVPTTYHVVSGERHSFDAWRRNANLSLPWVSRWFATHRATTVVNRVPLPDASYLPKLDRHYTHRHRHGSRQLGPLPRWMTPGGPTAPAPTTTSPARAGGQLASAARQPATPAATTGGIHQRARPTG